MTTSNKCNHALEIAEDMYNAYADGKDRYKHQPMVKYADLPDDDKAGWLNVAEQALPIIGKHAMEDVKNYLSGCVHSVDVTPDKTVICKGRSFKK